MKTLANVAVLTPAVGPVYGFYTTVAATTTTTCGTLALQFSAVS